MRTPKPSLQTWLSAITIAITSLRRLTDLCDCERRRVRSSQEQHLRVSTKNAVACLPKRVSNGMHLYSPQYAHTQIARHPLHGFTHVPSLSLYTSDAADQ